MACSASDRQGSNFEACVWRTVSSQSSHHPREVLLAQFSLYVHKGGLKPDSFHFILFLLAYDVPRTKDVGLATKFWSQPTAGSMPVNLLRRWPNTNPSLGLLYTLRKHVTFTQCCFNVDPKSSTLAQHWNSIGWLYCFLTAVCRWLYAVTFTIPAPETPDNMLHWPNAEVMLEHCMRRWANIIPIKIL